MIHSYTSLANWRLCPRLHYEQHVRKSVPFVETEATREGKRMHEAIEQAFNAGEPFPEARKGKAAELFELVRRMGGRAEVKVAMTRDGGGCGFFDDDKAWIRGVMDLYLAQIDKRVAIVVDWKSGNPNYTDEFQAEVYAAIVRACVPTIDKTLFVWSYPKAGTEKPLVVDTTQATRNVRRTAEAVEADETHAPRPGWKCRFCPVKTCEYNAYRTDRQSRD